MAVRDLIPRVRSRSPLARSERANPLVAFHQEVNRLFEDFLRGFDFEDFTPMPSFGFPHIELSETDKELKLEAELPGMDEKDVELLVSDGVLKLRGEKREAKDDGDRRFSERYYGRFERQITLPAEVQEDKVSATFKRGVLTVILPKSETAAAKVRRIPIFGK